MNVKGECAFHYNEHLDSQANQFFSKDLKKCSIAKNFFFISESTCKSKV